MQLLFTFFTESGSKLQAPLKSEPNLEIYIYNFIFNFAKSVRWCFGFYLFTEYFIERATC